MDGSAFRNLDFSWLPWALGFAAIGVLVTICAAGLGLFWIISHMQWVS